VALKQALERTGGFDVHPFTTSDAALEYVQSNPQDVALIDFTSVTPSGPTVVETLRRIQPGLPIVVSPEQPADVMAQLNLQASIDPPFNARDIMPLLGSAAQGEAATDLRKLSTRPVGSPPASDPTPAAPTTDVFKEAASPERKLRPGEIDESELRPYMYSSDVFKQRTTTDDLGKHDPSPFPTPRPGEYSTDELQEPSTDVFRRPSSGRLRPGEMDVSAVEPPPENRPRRAGEFQTSDLPAPSTDVFHEDAPKTDSGSLPPLERPTRRRTGSFNADAPAVQPDARPTRPGEYSEQDLLNLALNRESAASEPSSPSMFDVPSDASYGQYQVSTEIFKGDGGEQASLSAEDAAAMWEQLTREDASALTPAPEASSAAFEFEDPQETPAALNLPSTDVFTASLRDISFEDDPFPQPASSTDMLIEQAQQVVLPPDDASPLMNDESSGTEILLAAALDADMPIITSEIGEQPPPPEPEYNWDFPDQVELQDDPAPQIRQTTDGLPVLRQSDELNPLEEEQLREQYEVEALFGFTDDPAPPGFGSAEDVDAAFTQTYAKGVSRRSPRLLDEDIRYQDIDDAFEPPISAEQLITSYLNTEVEYDAQPDSDAAPAAPTEDKQAGVRRLEEIAEEIRRARAPVDLPPSMPESFDDPAESVFQRLAAEEPPMPDASDEGGTVGDLYSVVSDPEFQGVLRLLRTEDLPAESDEKPATKELHDLPGTDARAAISQSEIEDIFASYGRPTPAFTEFDFAAESEESSAAQVILETALTEDTPSDEFSLSNLIANIEQQLERSKSPIKPLPSWVKDRQLRDDTYIREPGFLAEVIAEVDALPQLDEDEQDYGDATTYAGEVSGQVSDMETEWLPAVTTRPARLPEQEWSLEPPIAEDDTDGGTKPLDAPALPRLEDDEPEFNTEFERLAAFSFPEEDESQFTPPMGIEAIQDPYIAQIALSLTQVSLEDVAGIVLTRENEIMANAGRLTRDEIMEIDAALAGSWDNETDQFNIRFITLPSSARDYMVYSKRTVSDLTLSLVFLGATPLRAIRSQAKRLLDALVSVPEPASTEGESITEATINSDVRAMYTYVWLLREPDQRLSDMVARAIESNMRAQLESRAWEVLNLRVQDEFIYIHADVPGETPPYEVVRDLKHRAFEIARKQNPALAKASLWADGYLVVAPGRELGEDEIQQFIQFERMI
jgi:REP element-mobilizing transposase RayT